MRTLYAVVVRPVGLETKPTARFAIIKVADPRNPSRTLRLRKAVDADGHPVIVKPAPVGRVIGRAHANLVEANQAAMDSSYPGRRAVVMNVDTLDFMDDAQSGREIAAEALKAVIRKAHDERVMTIVRAWFARKRAEDAEISARCWAQARQFAARQAA